MHVLIIWNLSEFYENKGLYVIFLKYKSFYAKDLNY
jgi:hypothetical protein